MAKLPFLVALALGVLSGCTATPRPELDAAVVSHAATYATLSPELSRQCTDPLHKPDAEIQARLRIVQEPRLAPLLTRKYAERLAVSFPEEAELAKRLVVYLKKFERNGLFGALDYAVACFYEVNGGTIRYLESRRGDGDRVSAKIGSLYRAMGGRSVVTSYFES